MDKGINLIWENIRSIHSFNSLYLTNFHVGSDYVTTSDPVCNSSGRMSRSQFDKAKQMCRDAVAKYKVIVNDLNEQINNDVNHSRPGFCLHLLNIDDKISYLRRMAKEDYNNDKSFRVFREDFIDYTNDIKEKIYNKKKSINNSKNKFKFNKPRKSKSSLFMPIGIEYTFHPVIVPDKTSILAYSTGDALDRITKKIKSSTYKPLQKLNKNDRVGYAMSRIYADGRCIEICSPAHKNWPDLRKWYIELVNALGSSVRPTSQKYPSGGAHINCSIPEVHGMKYMYNLICDMGNRPYLNWVFNDPCDNSTANWMFEDRHNRPWEPFSMVDYVVDHKEAWDDKHPNNKRLINQISRCVMNTDSRERVIRVKDSFHFEFRCFSSIRNERDLKDIVAFVDAYCRWIYDRTLSGECVSKVLDFNTVKLTYFNPGWNKEIEKFLDADNVRKNFNILLLTLGLDPKDYRRFVDRNFEVRRKLYGKDYLV